MLQVSEVLRINEKKKMRSVKVSVIMPVYNSGDYLKAAVESILNQSLRDLELILVDDGSTDGSSEKCDDYAAKDKRVVVIHESNGGICVARNAALTIARGEYIGFSDHDDEMERCAFASAYSFAKQHDLDLVKYGYDEVTTRGKKVLRRKCFSFKEVIYEPLESGLHYLEMLRDMAMDCVWDGLFRKSFLDKNNLRLNTDFKSGGEDIDFCGRMIGCLPKVGLMPGVFYHHLIRVGFSTSSKFNELNVSNALTFPNRMNLYLTGYNPSEIYNKNVILYAYTIVRRSIGPLLYNTSMPACNWSKDKIIGLLEKIRNNKAIDPCFFHVPKSLLFQKSVKYGFIYFFFLKRWYSLCLKMYRMREK
mgnify:CR=1 FL=1